MHTRQNATKTGPSGSKDEADNTQAELDELKSALSCLEQQRNAIEKENQLLRERLVAQTEKQNKQGRQGNAPNGGNSAEIVIQTDANIIPSKDAAVQSGLLEVVDMRGLTSPTETLTVNNYQSNSPAIAGITDDTSSLNYNLVRGILSHFETLQLNIALPQFVGIKNNPVEFIQNLEKYFQRRNVSNDLKLIFVEDSLKGRARTWFDARAIPFDNYMQFKEMFLKEFQFIEARMKAKATRETHRFRASEESFQVYFIDKLRLARFICPAQPNPTLTI